MTLTVHKEVHQGSDEWHQLRRGVLTASTIGALITTKPVGALEVDCPKCGATGSEPCKSLRDKTPIKTVHSERSANAARLADELPPRLAIATNDTARGLIASIVAERITEWEDPEYTNGDMERGHQVEPIARRWYEQQTGVTVEQVGFMVLDLGDGVRLGYSPDGLIGDDGLLEVKAPRARKHVLAHVNGEAPPEHMAQCQAGMFVSGRRWLDFISYVGGEPPFLTRVHADPDWFKAIENAARHFESEAQRMADAYKNATAGLARTDKLPDPYDIEVVI